MKRLHLRIAYSLLWVMTTGLFLIFTGRFRELAGDLGQGGAIAWFMLLFGPAFVLLYLMTAFLFDVRQDTITKMHITSFLYQRRVPIGLLVFSMILFVLFAFYGAPLKR